MADDYVACEGEFESAGPMTSQIRLQKSGTIVAVRHATIDNLAIYEGDIILSRPLEKLGAGITGTGFRWPKQTVIYDIDPDLTDQDRVTKAIEHWQARTVIRFEKRTTQSTYVYFKRGSSCASMVGMVGGVQFLTLGPQCALGNVIHEIGHAVGLWHEQSREDRDKHVTVVKNNIQPGREHNFDQRINDGDDLGSYDYGSMMHYPKNAFAIDPQKPTLITPNGEAIGQRAALSEGDVNAVGEMYQGV